MLRKLGAILAIIGVSTGIGYVLYWVFGVAYDTIPTPLKVAIVCVGLGFVILLTSILRERMAASREEDFKGVER